jgi:tetratricopeptide (TPR) repeat protein
LEPSVDQNKPTATAIQTENDLKAAVLGVHDYLNSIAVYGRDYVAGYAAMSDNGVSNGFSGRFIPQSTVSFTENSGFPSDLWNTFYGAIANANIAINADIESTPQVDYYKGQALALRALAHMNLQLIFGQQFSGGSLGIPYVTTYNEGNLYPPREPSADVWKKIGDDFSAAATMMDPSFDAGDPGYINYYAVKALQSRYYLYTGEFDKAIAAADVVINSGNYTLVAAGNLASEWASGSGPNSLFEAVFTSTDRTGTDNIARMYTASNYGDVEATADLYNAYDANDARLGLLADSTAGTTTNHGDYRMTGKYVDELGTDNIRIIRYAEVLLNKAEAYARRNNGTDRLTGALPIINNLSSTRGSSTVYTTGSPDEVLAERRLELAMEGQRFFDLLRNGKDIPFINTGKNDFATGADITYGSDILALPIPRAELDANSNMVPNPGY